MRHDYLQQGLVACQTVVGSNCGFKKGFAILAEGVLLTEGDGMKAAVSNDGDTCGQKPPTLASTRVE